MDAAIAVPVVSVYGEVLLLRGYGAVATTAATVAKTRGAEAVVSGLEVLDVGDVVAGARIDVDRVEQLAVTVVAERMDVVVKSE